MSELTLEAKTENLDKVLSFVDEHLEEQECPMKTQMQIDIAVEELFVNIAHYAYHPEVGPVTIRVEVQKEPLAVTVTLSCSALSTLAKSFSSIFLKSFQ